MKPRILSAVVVILAIASACALPSAAPVTQAATEASASTSMPALEPSAPAPTGSLETSVPTAQSVIAIKADDECIPIEDKVPDDLVLSGVWVINRYLPHLENIDEHTEYSIPLKGRGFFFNEDGDVAVSPDAKYLAYIDKYYNPINYRVEKRILRIIHSSGHSLDMSYWVEDWQRIIGWFDNQNIAIYTSKKEVIILNPFTGSWRRFQQPQWFVYDDSHYWYPFPYNRTLEWILDRLDYNSLALKKAQTGETVWKGNYSGQPVWSTNSPILAITSEASIAIIDNGKEDAEFDLTGIGVNYISNATLSPDGGKLAFQVYKNKSYNEEIIILDISQRKLARLCADEFSAALSSIWSPDSRFVVQEIYDTNRKSFDVLVDTQQMRAYKLISGQLQHRIVWLAKP